MAQDLVFVIISDVDWDGHWVCEQQIANVISETNTVLYIEQSRTILSFFQSTGGDTKPIQKLKLIYKGLIKKKSKLIVVSPPFLLPFKYLPIIYQINSKLRSIWLNKILTSIQIEKPIIITFDPDSAEIVSRINNKISIYYRNDNHDKRGLWFNPDRLVAERENELIRKVDLVIALSYGFATKCRELNDKTYIIPNGVNLELFTNSIKNLSEPSDISGIPHPRIGVIGMLDWRIDVGLLEGLAKRHQDWSIILVGPVNIKDQSLFKNLFKLKNVYFLGNKSVNDVPVYMKFLDVGLIPYLMNDYTKGILSLKIFEYSAAGIPTVATPMPELLAYSKFIHLAAGLEEFESCISKCLSGHSEKEARELINFAKLNTWQNRADQIMNIIKELSAK